MGILPKPEFHFGLPNLIQYKPKRHPGVLRAAFFRPGAVSDPARRGSRAALDEKEMASGGTPFLKRAFLPSRSKGDDQFNPPL
jgi:hypothetical protein